MEDSAHPQKDEPVLEKRFDQLTPAASWMEREAFMHPFAFLAAIVSRASMGTPRFLHS
jgi:hypothetical protein